MSDPAPAIAGTILPQLEGRPRKPRLKLSPLPLELLTFRQAAALLGISSSQIQRLHHNGRLGPVPIELGARCFRIARAELCGWCAAGCPPRREWLLSKRDSETRQATT